MRVRREGGRNTQSMHSGGEEGEEEDEEEEGEEDMLKSIMASRC